MAINFLTAVNETMKRVGKIKGASGELTSFEESARQLSIDRMIQIWNETVVFCYNITGEPFSKEGIEFLITLVDQQREYDLPTNLLRINWPLINEDDGRRIFAYPNGFTGMRNVQLQPDNWTGTPIQAAVNPTNGKLRMDTIPQSDDAGEAYTLFYDAEILLKFENDIFPFPDTVTRQLYPAVAAIWRDDKGQGTNTPGARQALAIAVSLIPKTQLRKRY